MQLIKKCKKYTKKEKTVEYIQKKTCTKPINKHHTKYAVLNKQYLKKQNKLKNKKKIKKYKTNPNECKKRIKSGKYNK